MVEIKHLDRSNAITIPDEVEIKTEIQNKGVHIGKFIIEVDKRGDQFVAICRNCGCDLSYLGVSAAETGFYYCSNRCAKEDVEEEMKTIEVAEAEKKNKMECEICGRETYTDRSICDDCAWEYEEPPEWYGGD